MKKRVGVIGNGYVGSGMARLFAGAFDVVVHDPPQGWENRDSVNSCDLAVICVPTPMSPDGSADVSLVEESVQWCTCPLILIKSTVPPGTTDRLRGQYGKDVHFSPEYMGEPRNYVAPWRGLDPRDARTHPFVIVGGPRASTVLDFFLAVMAVDARYMMTTAIEAELTKYMENTYFAMKVAFCNEWATIADHFGVDYKRLRELWLLDPRVEADHTAVFRDSPGFGGKCLPKDLSAIIEASADRGYVPELLQVVREMNVEWRRS